MPDDITTTLPGPEPIAGPAPTDDDEWKRFRKSLLDNPRWQQMPLEEQREVGRMAAERFQAELQRLEPAAAQPPVAEVPAAPTTVAPVGPVAPTPVAPEEPVPAQEGAPGPVGVFQQQENAIPADARFLRKEGRWYTYEAPSERGEFEATEYRVDRVNKQLQRRRAPTGLGIGQQAKEEGATPWEDIAPVGGDPFAFGPPEHELGLRLGEDVQAGRIAPSVKRQRLRARRAEDQAERYGIDIELAEGYMALPPIGAKDTFKGNWYKAIPGFGVGFDFGQMGRLYSDVVGLQSMQAENPDADLSDTPQANRIRSFLDERAEVGIRGRTFWGDVTLGLLQLPPFMIEFMAAGGGAAIGRKIGTRAAFAAGGRGFARGLGGRGVRWFGGAIGRTLSPVMLPRVGQEMFSRMLPRGMRVSERGQLIINEAGEKPWTAFLKAFGGVFIENLSETAGAQSKLLRRFTVAKFPRLNAASRKLIDKLGGRKYVMRRMRTLGWDGFIEEFGEERLAGLLRGIVKLDDDTKDLPLFERLVKSTMPRSGRDALVEAVILLAPAVGANVAGAGVQALGRRVTESGELQPTEGGGPMLGEPITAGETPTTLEPKIVEPPTPPAAPPTAEVAPQLMQKRQAAAISEGALLAEVEVEAVEPATAQLYPRAGDEVDGRKVGAQVPNLSSIEATIEHPDVLPGIREVPLSAFTLDEAGVPTDKASRELAGQIQESGEVAPLIVGIDEDGPYIIEGIHRYDALKVLGAKSFPAIVASHRDAVEPAAATLAPATAKKAPVAVTPAQQPKAITAVGTPPAREAGKYTLSGLPVTATFFNTPPSRFEGYAWRLMGLREFEKLLAGEKTYGGKVAGKGQFLSPTPEGAAQHKQPGKILVEFAGVEEAEGETVSNLLARANVTDAKQWTGDQWEQVKLPQIAAEQPEAVTEPVGETTPPETAKKAVTPEKPPVVAKKPAKKRVISDDAYQKALKTFTQTRLRAGLDPTMLKDAVTVGLYHVENGLRTFAAWSAKMAQDMGEEVKPHLRKIWDATKVRAQQAAKTAAVRKVEERGQAKLATRTEQLRAKIKAIKDTTKQRDALKKELVRYITDTAPKRDWKRLARMVTGATTKAQMNKAADRIISSIEAYGAGADVILTDEQLATLKEKHERKGARVAWVARQREITQTQTELIEFIEEHVPAVDNLRGRFLRTLKNTVKPDQLERVRESVLAVAHDYEHRQGVKEYKKTAKLARDIIGGPRRNPKMPREVVQKLKDALSGITEVKMSDAVRDRLRATAEAQDFDDELRDDFEYQRYKREAEERLSHLDDTLIRDMDLDDIELLTKALKRIIHEGKAVQEYKVRGKLRQRADDVSETVPQIEARVPEKYPGEAEGGGEAAKTSRLRRYWDNILDAQRFFMNMTWVDTSAPVEHYKDILFGRLAQLGWIQRGQKEVTAALRKAGITVDRNWIYSQRKKSARGTWLRKGWEIVRGQRADRIEITLPADPARGIRKAETLVLDPATKQYLVLFFEDPYLLRQVLKKNSQGLSLPSQFQRAYKMTPARVRAIQATFTKEDIAIAHAIRDFLNGPLWQEVQTAFEEMMGYPLAEMPNHAPGYVNMEIKGGQKADPFEQMYNPQIQSSGRFKTRTGTTLPYYAHDIWSVYHSQLMILSSMATMANPIKNAQRFFHSPKMNTAVKTHLGPHYMQRIDEFLRSVAGTEMPSRTTGQRTIRWLRSKRVASALALAIRVAVMQRTSGPLIGFRVGLDATKYGTRYLKHVPQRIIDEMLEYSPWIWARKRLHGAAQIMTPVQARSDPIETFLLGTVRQHPGMTFLQSQDIGGIAVTWGAVKYDFLEKRGKLDLLERPMSEWDEKLRTAFVEEHMYQATASQPTFDMVTLSGYQREARKDAWFSTFMSFMSFKTKATNMMIEEQKLWQMRDRPGVKGHNARDATLRMVGLGTWVIGVNKATKAIMTVLLGGGPVLTARYLAGLLGGADDEENKRRAGKLADVALTGIGNDSRQTTLLGSAIRLVGEAISFLPVGNVPNSAIRWLATQAEGKDWRLRPEDANAVAGSLKTGYDTWNKIAEAAKVEPGKFESGPRAGKSRKKVKWTEAADKAAEAVDALVLALGYRSGKRLVKGAIATIKGDSKKAVRSRLRRYYKVMELNKRRPEGEEAPLPYEAADLNRDMDALGMNRGAEVTAAKRHVKERYGK